MDLGPTKTLKKKTKNIGLDTKVGGKLFVRNRHQNQHFWFYVIEISQSAAA